MRSIGVMAADVGRAANLSGPSVLKAAGSPVLVAGDGFPPDAHETIAAAPNAAATATSTPLRSTEKGMRSNYVTRRIPRHGAPRQRPIMTSTIDHSDTFHLPQPSFALMRMLDVVNRWVLLRAYFRIRDLDFPQDDLSRLRSVVNERTAAFIAPNHPEFGLDWMMDKELSTLVAPRVACWASHGIVASAPWFWTRNNLVANNGGEAARRYSVDWAMRGYGVLLHPEGSVRWTSDVIHPLFTGIAEMAADAARRIHDSGGDRPTHIAPIVWKYR